MREYVKFLTILTITSALLIVGCSPKEREHLNPYDPEYPQTNTGTGGGGGATGLQPREGNHMWQITINGAGNGTWYGWGIAYITIVGSSTNPNTQNISSYSNLVLSIASSNQALTNLGIGMISTNTNLLKKEGWVNASEYGYTNDGKWHDLVIPLSVFQAQGVNLTNVWYVFANNQGNPSCVPVGARFYLDNIYLLKSDGTTHYEIYSDTYGKLLFETAAKIYVWPDGSSVSMQEITK
jgi:hypothetical protein